MVTPEERIEILEKKIEELESTKRDILETLSSLSQSGKKLVKKLGEAALFEEKLKKKIFEIEHESSKRIRKIEENYVELQKKISELSSKLSDIEFFIPDINKIKTDMIKIQENIEFLQTQEKERIKEIKNIVNEGKEILSFFENYKNFERETARKLEAIEEKQKFLNKTIKNISETILPKEVILDKLKNISKSGEQLVSRISETVRFERQMKEQLNILKAETEMLIKKSFEKEMEMFREKIENEKKSFFIDSQEIIRENREYFENLIEKKIKEIMDKTVYSRNARVGDIITHLDSHISNPEKDSRLPEDINKYNKAELEKKIPHLKELKELFEL